MTIQPNQLMVQFLLAVRDHARDGGHLAALTDLDPLETTVAVSVGQRQGWLTDGCDLTHAGANVLRSTRPVVCATEPMAGNKISFADLYLDRTGTSKSVYDHIKRQMPPVLMAALEELHIAKGGHEQFEKRHDLPHRSAKVVVRVAVENYDLLMASIL